jgi:hypothetical protein
MQQMVKFIGAVLFAVLYFLPTQAQHTTTFEISIPPSYHLEASNTDADRLNAMMAANSQARSILSSVTVTSFHQEFPGSHYLYLRNIYQLTCTGTYSNDSAVLSLHSVDPVNFPYLRQSPEITPLGSTYTPNDYHGVAEADCSPQLDFINAKTAWGITKGNPKITIGINDPSGFDLHNPDLAGQIVGVDSFNQPNYHGTIVAGCAAAHTDNGKGVAAIGFNCTLSVDSRGGDNVNLLMSNNGIRILNNSWFYGGACTNIYGPGTFVFSELVYDEVYENGASTCFAAGNGLSGGGHCLSLFDYTYPGSLDHIITVGPVGHLNPPGTLVAVNSSTPPSGIPWLWKYCHEESPGNSIDQYGTLNYEANDRVDICAPAYDVVSTNYVPGDTSSHYTGGACGTSFATPMVCGSIGLMLSANPCLSPYQVEYLLKTTAHSMDYIEYPPGSGKNLNEFYAGKMGAGALDAGAAVTAASTFDCNDTATQTMYIEGIELNTICAPGYSSNGVKPKFTPIIAHGIPPYTYRWDPIPGNNTTLDDYTSASPTVTSGNLAVYRLGVYDASPIPREASRFIVVYLTNADTPQLVMRDSYMDMLDEPNSQTKYDGYDWQIWTSPDLVNRLADDHMPANQNPLYAPSVPNYATACIRNVGCKASSGADLLDLYWTKAGTGQTWPVDWTTATFTNPITGISSPAGGQITVTPITIPAIQPGAVDTVSAAWFPPDPLSYDPSIQSVDISLLGRIETSATPPYGMTTHEGPNTALNVSDNNKIATRSLIVNTSQGTSVLWHQILIANAEDTNQVFSLEFASEKQLHPSFSGDISSYADVQIELGALFDRWVKAGSQGTNVLVDAKSKSVVFNGDSKIILKGITIHANEKVAVKVGIILLQQPVTDQYFHIRQWRGTPNETSIPYGNVSFLIPACPGCTVISNHKTNTVPFATGLNVYPNPASNNVTVLYTGYDASTLSFTVSDISGQIVYKQSGLNVIYGSENTIDISSLNVGLYFIKITDLYNNSTIIKMVKD